MKRLLFLPTLILMAWVTVMAQRTAPVVATYTYYAPESMSVEEAKHIALERAQADAIAAEFGTIVTQSNTMVVSNDNGNSDSRLYSLGVSEVKGEWLVTFGEPEFDVRFEQNMMVVSVKCKGRIRELDPTAPRIEVKIFRNGFGENNLSESFRDGDDFYMSVRPASAGYLSAYMLDETSRKVYRILPYVLQSEANILLKENELYQFFSSEGLDAMSRALVDSYTMSCDADVEFNRLFVLFSEQPFVGISADRKVGDDSVFEIDESQFFKWLLKKRSTPGMRVVERTIKVSRRDR